MCHRCKRFTTREIILGWLTIVFGMIAGSTLTFFALWYLLVRQPIGAW